MLIEYYFQTKLLDKGVLLEDSNWGEKQYPNETSILKGFQKIQLNLRVISALFQSFRIKCW